MTELFSAEDRTFLYYIQCQWHPFIFLFCLMTHMYAALSLVLIGKIAKRLPTELKVLLGNRVSGGLPVSSYVLEKNSRHINLTSKDQAM